MKISSVLLSAFIGAVVALGAVQLVGSKGDETASHKETAFERVMRTGVIRCGYYVFPPMTYRDPNTAELSGFSVDFMNSLASRAGLKVEWAEEVTFGNWVPAMQARRFDAVCTPMWPDAPMFKVVSFTEPLFYAGMSPLVRADDDRFGNDLGRVNQPDVTFVTQEGNMTDQVTRAAFPKAQFHVLSANVDGAQYYQTILTKKADAILTDQNGLYQFGKANGQGLLKFVAPERPVRLQSFPLVVGRNDLLLKDFFDQSIREMNNNGEIDRLLRKWEPEPGKTYMRASVPARTTEQ